MELDINGAVVAVDVDGATPLLFVLRNDLGLTAAKLGCGLEQCGACTVIIDGHAATSCATPVSDLAGKKIVTPEGVGAGGLLHPVQQALLDEQAAQCGYCIPGIVSTAVALLENVPNPTREQIVNALDGNLCRCGSHPRILRAVERAARAIASGSETP
jgi:nicotinate dehydrogenase subunit A